MRARGLLILGALLLALAGAAPARAAGPAHGGSSPPTATAPSATVPPPPSGPPPVEGAYTVTPPTAGALYRDGQTGRYLLGGQWLYRPDPAGVGIAAGWWQDSGDTSGWSPVAVPSSFNVGDFSSASMAGAVGWYRRDFTIPAGAFDAYVPAQARRWIVRFESVNYNATVWLNGRELGTHEGAYLPFELDAGTLRTGINRLVVRVDSTHVTGDLPSGPANGWWNYGGMLREVYLRAVQEADISGLQVQTQVGCRRCAATISEQVVVRNVTGRPRTVRLSGRYGPLALAFGQATIAPGATWTAQAAGLLAHPRLWSPASPYLYRATLTLTDAAGRRLGGYVTYSGVRTIARTPDGRLTLNGMLLNVRGVNLHEQSLDEGAALDSAHLARLFQWAKALGATMIRAHYPLNPQLEEMADREGMLLWSEVPVYGTTEANLADPTYIAKSDAFLAANIAANVNHPSVLVWSIGNELPDPASGNQAHYIAGAVALAHRLDPTRPVGMALSVWPGLGCQSAYAPLDVVGVNDYMGWYDAGGGTTDDRDGLSAFLDGIRACYPAKAVFVTEFGFEANRNGPVEERGTYAFQANSAAYHLDVFASKPWLSGALYFPLQDFAVEPGWTGGNPWPDPPFLHKGLIDLTGVPKPAYAAVSAIFHATRQFGAPVTWPAPPPSAALRGARGARRAPR